MLNYPITATTFKTIDKFTYNLYRAIDVNMLKYNNDSSAALRILKSLVVMNLDLRADLPYAKDMAVSGMNYTSIDRLRRFSLAAIPNIDVSTTLDTVTLNYLIGYSIYTNKCYLLENVPNKNDFLRHSFPCDAFLSGQAFTPSVSQLNLSPNIKIPVNSDIKSTAVTLRVMSGLHSASRSTPDPVSIIISGRDIIGSRVEEIIQLTSVMDVVTKTEFTYIYDIMAINTNFTLVVKLFPYILGDMDLWFERYFDREGYEDYSTVAMVDYNKKALALFVLNDNGADYPVKLDPVKYVKLDLPEETTIISHYVDMPNKLLYILSAEGLYCFPLIIPATPCNTLDKEKTLYQSVKVEYYEDSVNEKYTFYVFPTERTNEIEVLNVYVNEEPVVTNMVLDLITYDITTNRIEIPFSTLFANAEQAIVRFESTGIQQSTLPLYLDNTSLKQLYFASNEGMRTSRTGLSSHTIWADSYEVSAPRDYQDLLGTIDDPKLFKLSSGGNITMNGSSIVNVFKTFSFDQLSSSVVVSDTISNITASNTTTLPF